MDTAEVYGLHIIEDLLREGTDRRDCSGETSKKFWACEIYRLVVLNWSACGSRGEVMMTRPTHSKSPVHNQGCSLLLGWEPEPLTWMIPITTQTRLFSSKYWSKHSKWDKRRIHTSLYKEFLWGLGLWLGGKATGEPLSTKKYFLKYIQFVTYYVTKCFLHFVRCEIVWGGGFQ